MNRRIWPGLALAMVVVTSPALAGKKLENIPLVWKPTDTKAAGVVDLTGLLEVRIQVDPFVDTRADKARFGENREDKEPRPVTTSGNAADFCTQNFAKVLRDFGLTVVPEGGDVVVGAELLEFLVLETDTYNGEVRLKVSVTKGGKPRWTGVTAGTSKRFGRSYKADNYYETLSDALLRAAQSLVRDPGFRAVLSEK